MEIYDSNYDIDNIDVEAEMISQDIEDDEQELQDTLKKHEEENIRLLSKKLNMRNLDVDLSRNDESKRNVYNFEYNSHIYEGFVVYKKNNNEYIFSVKDDSSKGEKLIKINLTETKQIH